jgi:hypothetical protein
MTFPIHIYIYGKKKFQTTNQLWSLYVSQLNTWLSHVLLLKSGIFRTTPGGNGNPSPIVTELTLKLVVAHHPGRNIGKIPGRSFNNTDLWHKGRCILQKVRLTMSINRWFSWIFTCYCKSIFPKCNLHGSSWLQARISPPFAPGRFFPKRRAWSCQREVDADTGKPEWYPCMVCPLSSDSRFNKGKITIFNR